MVVDTLHTPFEIVLKDMLDECPCPPHRHSFFELAYIVSGTGQQSINDSTFAYRAGHLFLLAPEDTHFFKIEEPTQFLFIRLNHEYLRAGKTQTESVERLQYLLQHANQVPGCVLRNLADKAFVHPLMQALIRERANRDVYHDELIQQLLNTLLVVVVRNIALSLPEQLADSAEAKVLSIARYLQAHIYQPEKLKAAHVSDQFGIAEIYLGRYFKKHTGETMQQYVTNYKLQLIEHRLRHTNLRIGEIADELGFTDKSHLGRIFKKYRGVNPAEYRKAASPLP